jgi:hypothetical protein
MLETGLAPSSNPCLPANVEGVGCSARLLGFERLACSPLSARIPASQPHNFILFFNNLQRKVIFSIELSRLQRRFFGMYNGLLNRCVPCRVRCLELGRERSPDGGAAAQSIDGNKMRER